MAEPKFEGEENELDGGEPVIEHAKKEDCPGIVEVDRDRMMQRFEEHQVPLREFNESERLQNLEARLEKGIGENGGEGFVLVLKISGQVVGYIEFEKNIEMEKRAEIKNTIFIDTISIIRKYQGRNLALGLLKRGEEEAKKIFNPQKIRAGVILENLPAVKFWTDEKKAGYKQIGKPEPRIGSDGKPILWEGKPSYHIVVEKDLEEGK